MFFCLPVVIDDMDALFPAEEVGREGEEDIVHALLSFLDRLTRDAHHRVLVVTTPLPLHFL